MNKPTIQVIEVTNISLQRGEVTVQLEHQGDDGTNILYSSIFTLDTPYDEGYPKFEDMQEDHEHIIESIQEEINESDDPFIFLSEDYEAKKLN